MSAVMFDTLKFTRRLKDVGVSVLSGAIAVHRKRQWVAAGV